MPSNPINQQPRRKLLNLTRYLIKYPNKGQGGGVPKKLEDA